MGKDQKKDPYDVSKSQFEEPLAKMIKVYKERPELMQSYLTDRKKS